MENQMKMEFLSKPENEYLAQIAVATFASQLEPTLEELGDIRTSVSEAVTNCIVHAYPNSCGTIWMCCQILNDNVLDIVIKDKGVGIPNINQARKPFFDSVNVKSNGKNGTIVHMRRKIKG